MTEELKPCPFCGSSNTTLDYYEISCPQELGTIVVCNDCGASAKSIVDWNTRPIEDALRAQVEKAEKMVARLIEAGDNHIHMAIASVRQQDQYYALVAEWKASKDGGGE